MRKRLPCRLLAKLGGDCKWSRNHPTPKWLSSKWFRYGFLLFFLTMFGNMLFQTCLVASGAKNLTEAIIGLAVMALFKPRSWCVFCPMSTMTQTICKIKTR